MRKSLVEILRCPFDLNRLTLNIQQKNSDDNIINGQLLCNKCKRTFPIEKGVPNMVPPDIITIEEKNLGQLQNDTVERFGFEWSFFRDWGWLTELPDIPKAKEKFFGGLSKNTYEAFWSKSLFQKEDLHKGLYVLDAGCGNGRFTNQVAQTGAEVFGIELGWGVFSAFDHTKHLPNVHIIRADLFRPPFENETFDRIYSIGVLMHTGNAKAAFDSLVRLLRINGLIVAHVYGKGNNIYELLDEWIRNITTRLSISKQLRFARLAAALTCWLRNGGKFRTKLYWYLYRYINLLPTEHHMFDWYSAPIATHHTLDEIYSWFSKNNLEILRSNPQYEDRTSESARRRIHASITVLGQRKDNNYIE